MLAGGGAAGSLVQPEQAEAEDSGLQEAALITTAPHHQH